jgi:hypothetical protein
MAYLDPTAGSARGAHGPDLVFTQAANVAALGALTSSAPAAVTSSAPAALTSAAATGGDAPTEAEYNALRTDVAALRTTLAAAQTDVVNLRATLLAVQADVAAMRTKVNATLSAATGTGKAMATA